MKVQSAARPMNKTPLEHITALLNIGDAVSIERGRLVIATHDGRQVPDEWLDKHELPVITAICELAAVTAYRYCGYSTGCYVAGNGGGVTLQLRDLITGASAYIIFNADVRYSRNTKHHKCGKRMPHGQFRPHKHSAFCLLWQSTGMALPSRLSTFHDRMGKLSGYIYAGEETKPERLSAQTFRPLCISETRLRELLNLPEIHRTITRQAPDNHQTITRQGHQTSKSPQPLPDIALSTVQATGANYYGKKVKRGDGYKGPTVTPVISPIEQTTDEWLNDYDQASNN